MTTTFQKVVRSLHLMIVAFCNPLIDATVERDAAYLAKWNLRNGDAILAGPEHQPLVDETVNDPKVFMTGGGSCQNTLVMAQWMLQEPGKTAIVGAVGDDPNRKVLENIISDAFVKCLYQVLPGKFTGCGVILVVDNDRSIVASVAASACFEFDHWDTPEVLSTLHSAAVCLVSVYFLRSSDRTALAVTAECLHHNIPLAITLASPTAVDSEAWPALRQMFRVCQIVFGNQTEIIVLAQKLGIIGKDVTEETADYKSIIKALAEFDKVDGRKRLIVCTFGAQPTLGCETGGEVIERAVLPIDTSKIVDTNGAGDSFAGGFLALYTKGASLEKCIDAGSYAARANLMTRGCAVPTFKPDFK